MRANAYAASLAGCSLFVGIKQIASRKPNALATAIHLHVHQSLWAATNALNAAVHIATPERISGGMSFDTPTDCEVFCGRPSSTLVRLLSWPSWPQDP